MSHPLVPETRSGRSSSKRGEILEGGLSRTRRALDCQHAYRLARSWATGSFWHCPHCGDYQQRGPVGADPAPADPTPQIVTRPLEPAPPHDTPTTPDETPAPSPAVSPAMIDLPAGDPEAGRSSPTPTESPDDHEQTTHPVRQPVGDSGPTTRPRTAATDADDAQGRQPEPRPAACRVRPQPPLPAGAAAQPPPQRRRTRLSRERMQREAVRAVSGYTLAQATAALERGDLLAARAYTTIADDLLT